MKDSRPDNLALDNLAPGGSALVTGGFNDGESYGRALAKKGTTDPLALVSTNAGECSLAAGAAPGDACASARVVNALKDFIVEVGYGGSRKAPPKQTADSTLPTASTSAAVTVRDAAHTLGCSSEACVVSHPQFLTYAAERVGKRSLEKELATKYKTEGPRNNTKLLTNVDIDSVLQEWAAAAAEFFNYNFNMMDFERTGDSLARIDPTDILAGRATQDLGSHGGRVRRPCRTFACVLNTDVSSGPGKHWVSIFGDCRGSAAWTVEYFNSSGNPPPEPVVKWLESTASRLEAFRRKHPSEYGASPVSVVVPSGVRHQDSRTECGVYALYHIRRRLDGGTPQEFHATRIPDASMIEFRRHLFRESV